MIMDKARINLKKFVTKSNSCVTSPHYVTVVWSHIQTMFFVCNPRLRRAFFWIEGALFVFLIEGASVKAYETLDIYNPTKFAIALDL